jgi:trans-2,3-dihydro-3-hydroxyanthranilate isomerase
MAHTYRYLVVDVFTQQPLEGNPLAVFADASGMDDATMQKIAKELNLSETTFVFPATRRDCAANVRIFTPTKEMMFAGHPTVGTAYVLLQNGKAPKNANGFALEEKVGAVPIRVEGDAARPLIWLVTPPIRWGAVYERELCAKALDLPSDELLEFTPQTVDAGNPGIFVGVKSKEAVDRAWLDSRGMALLQGREPERKCVFLFAPTPAGAYSRMFAPEFGIVEDPATGSLTGPLAAYMMRHGLVAGRAGTRFISEQGVKMGRRSILHVHIRGEQGAEGIEVGGYVTPLVEATMTF